MYYEAIDTQTHALYRGKNVAELRESVESQITLPSNLPPQYAVWSNSRCITYLVQAGVIAPYNGPEWFMALGTTTPQDVSSDRPQKMHSMIEMIDHDGSVIHDCQAQIAFWESRNHVRLAFLDHEHVYNEVFITEQSMRKLWKLFGKLMGFDPNGLQASLQNLPAPRLHTPHVMPESLDAKPATSFDIFQAINDLDLEPDDDNDDDFNY